MRYAFQKRENQCSINMYDKFCCGHYVYKLAKILTLLEILAFLLLGITLFELNSNIASLVCTIYLLYLMLEFFGIHGKNSKIVIFGCMARVISTVLESLLFVQILFRQIGMISTSSILQVFERLVNIYINKCFNNIIVQC